MSACTLCGRDDKTSARLLRLTSLVFLLSIGVFGVLLWALVEVQRLHVVMVPVPIPAPTPILQGDP